MDKLTAPAPAPALDMEVSPMNLDFVTSTDFNLWSQRHAQGEVPSQWPYGLEHMVDHGVRVIPRYLSSNLRDIAVSSVSGRVTRPVARFNNPTSTWDEITATRLWLSTRSAPDFTGVIWLTDFLLRSEHSLKRRLVLRMLRDVSCIWTLSEAQSNLLAESVSSAAKIETLKFGIDADYFTYLEYPSDSNLVVSFGNDKDRDIEGSMRVARRVRALRPGVQFVFQTNRDIDSEPGIRIVHSLSHSEIRALYSKAAAVLVLTRQNTHVSGMTVALEAMASGRPVVMSRTIGACEYVRHGTDGFLVECGDEVAAAAAIDSLLNDPSGACSIGLESRSSVESRFTTQIMTSRMAGLVYANR